jgi:hypothetical protein
MFFRTKTSGTRSYLQIVENRWEDGRPKQRVIATLGRLDQLQQTGKRPVECVWKASWPVGMMVPGTVLHSPGALRSSAARVDLDPSVVSSPTASRLGHWPSATIRRTEVRPIPSRRAISE